MNRKSVLVHAESIDFSDPSDIIGTYGFKKTRCNTFITSKTIENIEICFCGLPLERHHTKVKTSYLNRNSNYPTEWNYKEHTTNDEETDAYGEFKYKNDSKRHTSKYLRIDFRTDVKEIAEVLFEAWKLHRPKLLISVTGGAKNFKMKSNIKNAFKKAIFEAATSTDAWLVTGGTEEGIMKVIGEAFRESTIRLGDRRKLVLLGIANWTTIRNNHLLIRKNDVKINDYNREEDDYKSHSDYTYIEKDKGAYLDPNHTHFLLVDKAELNSYGGEIDFSTKLIDFICDSNSDDSTEIPVVVLVVGGGPNTLKVVSSSCAKGSPCLFIDIQGSNGSSNILAYVYRMIEEKLSKLEKESITDDLIDKTLEDDIFTKCKNIWNKKDDEIKEMVSTITEIFKINNFHLLNAFSIESTKQTNEMDEAILHAILKAEKSRIKKKLQQKKEEEEAQEKNLLISQLKLALTWDRIDVAKKYIFENDIMDIFLLNEPMYVAINKDRPDFVQEFLNYGLKLPKYLTYRVLLRLYNDVSENSAFYNLYTRNKFGKKITLCNKKKPYDIQIRFKDIGLIIKQLLDNFYENEYLKKPYDCLTSKDTWRILSQSDEYGQKKKDIEQSILFFSET
ncbi:unnamed protein product [Brachionus calyciflorus]|uniref:TRPM SLOG domain-containing protein n=1 Tax=Brachionus calyciflorus TaxID=104777 RepID=A0A814CUJ2_9BILA|nr:unnamed protein product [Brachionus calyciflorus]